MTNETSGSLPSDSKSNGCPDCKGSGWVYWDELDDYDGPALYGYSDDTHYLCRRCTEEADVRFYITYTDPDTKKTTYLKDASTDHWVSDMNDATDFKSLDDGMKVASLLKRYSDVIRVGG